MIILKGLCIYNIMIFKCFIFIVTNLFIFLMRPGSIN